MKAEHPSANAAARYEAQRLAFAPLMFQACRALRDLGILEQLALARTHGLTATEAVELLKNPAYATQLLLEAGLASGLCSVLDLAPEPRFFITPMGAYWLRDPLTRVNAEFNHHVCYRGAFQLRDALMQGRPTGLPTIDATGAATVYEALRSLPPEVMEAWFDFDHHYSDEVFELCLPHVLEAGTRSVVDIGGNTGRFARLCLDRGAHVTLVDLPGQLDVARKGLAAFDGRFTLVPANLLDATVSLPAGADVYWLSQFLDCFSEPQILSILKRVRAAMRPDSRVLVLETFWDQQQHDAARFCVIGTSLYFACIANGTSRMYHSRIVKRLMREAGLAITTELPHVGLSHTLLAGRVARL